MTLRVGVTLREGEGSKTGGTQSVDGNRMSKKDFELFARTSAGGPARGVTDMARLAMWNVPALRSARRHPASGVSCAQLQRLELETFVTL